MKKIIISAIAIVCMISCNKKSSETHITVSEPAVKVDNTEVEAPEQIYSCSMHPEVKGAKGEKCPKCGMELTVPVVKSDDQPSKVVETPTVAPSEVTTPQAPTKPILNNAPSTKVVINASTGKHAFAINEIVSNYLKIKNALTIDDSKGAAIAGSALYTSLNSPGPNTPTSKSGNGSSDIANDAKQHAKYIGDNAGKIDQQRAHFVMLSKDINDFIKMYGTGDQKLYQDFCPMADGGKGAIWISEFKAIKNPYYGSGMLTCGSVKQQF